MSETRDRFLREIAARVPVERLVEVHVFPPLKQGGVESGVAVVAARPPAEAAPPAEGVGAAEAPGESSRAATAAVQGEAAGDGAAPAAEQRGEGGGEGGEPPVAVDTADAEAGTVAEEALEPAARGAVGDAVVAGEAAGGAAAGEEGGAEAGEGGEMTTGGEPTAGGERGAPPENHDAAAPVADQHPSPAPDTGAFPPPPAPDERLTVYTATYRLVLKGPDRGKWEVTLVAEADAPLAAVDRVVRGVQRRSGDLGDAERVGPDAIAPLLEDPECATPTR